MDQAIVQRPKRRRIDPQPFGHAGPEAFDRNVGGLAQRMNDSASFFGFQIDRDAALVAVGAEKYSSETGSGKRRPAPGFIALPYRLHLDDLGAEIAEILRAERTGQHFREVEHANSGERFCHGDPVHRKISNIIYLRTNCPASMAGPCISVRLTYSTLAH